MPIQSASSSTDCRGPRKQNRPSRIDTAPLMKASTRSEVPPVRAEGGGQLEDAADDEVEAEEHAGGEQRGARPDQHQDSRTREATPVNSTVCQAARDSR
ncbi:hypothetical protein SVIOM342S_06360 [Streptomyces violaceorubidus]